MLFILIEWWLLVLFTVTATTTIPSRSGAHCLRESLTNTLCLTHGALSNGKNKVLKLTGTIAGNVSVIVPDGIEKTYVIQNATTGAFTVTVKTTSGTGPTFSATDKTNKLVYSDGTDIIEYSDNLSNVASNGFAVAMAIAL